MSLFPNVSRYPIICFFHTVNNLINFCNKTKQGLLKETFFSFDLILSGYKGRLKLFQFSNVYKFFDLFKSLNLILNNSNLLYDDMKENKLCIKNNHALKENGEMSYVSPLFHKLFRPNSAVVL